MKCAIKGHGELEIEGLTLGGLPAMRLVQYHSPEMTVNAFNGNGYLRVKLRDVDLGYPLRAQEPVVKDRAQLDPSGGYDANGSHVE